MAGPWEQYQQAAPVAEGPWSRYATTEPQRANVQAEKPSFKDYATGLLEVPVTLGTGLAAAAVSPVAGVVRQLVSGRAPFGTPEAATEAEQYAAELAKTLTYAPRTQPGQEAISALQRGTEATKIPPFMPALGIPQAIGTAAAIQPAMVAAAAPLAERTLARRAIRTQQSYDRAAKIDAAQQAVQYGVNLNPAESNPNLATRGMLAIAGEKDINNTLSKSNLPTWNALAREDMGLPENIKLDAAAIEKAHSNPDLQQPYDAVRKIPSLAADQSITDALDGLRIKSLIGGETSAAAVDKLVDNAIKQVQEGITGSDAVDSIRSLRSKANAIYRTQNKGVVAPAPEALAVADAQIGIANTLESLIENNIKSPTLLGDLRNARTKQAQIYDWERAINTATAQVEPKVLASMLEEGKPLSDKQSAIGNIAANYPEIARTENLPTMVPRVTRAGAAGSLGAALGWTTMGYPGAIAGGIAGAALGEASRLGILSRMRDPRFQVMNALPPDYRIPLNELAAQRGPMANVPVPYDWQQNINVGQPGYQPNWVYGQGVAPEVQAGIPPAINRLAAPTDQDVMNLVARQRAQDYRSQQIAEQTAAAQAEATAAAQKAPTTGGTLYELDPITGKLREVSQGLKGATPDVLRDLGTDLASAAEKVSSNRRFDMSAAEKIAWDKTKVDLAEVMPDFAKLSDKAVTERMMDRQWIADTIQKSREKAAAFEDIAKRAKEESTRREAAINRERMLDLAEMMEEQLRNPRPTGKASQGPKTREAIRNQLAGESENQNALAR